MDDDFDCQLEFNKENEIQKCEVSELEATTTTTEQSNNSVVKSDTNKERGKNPPSKSKRVSTFKKQWIKDPKYRVFHKFRPPFCFFPIFVIFHRGQILSIDS